MGSSAACMRLLHELQYESHLRHPFCIPFCNYVRLWADSLPIKTIIIGQNPYPQNIYPEYGSGLAYDINKQRVPTGSIKVIAEDLFNYNQTSKELTIECFRDSWRLLDIGVLMINESVFSRISKDRVPSNTGAIREMEAQVRAIQILLAEGLSMGQDEIICIGMGKEAAKMTSILRGWCPNDLMSMKVITCSNPAAFASNLRDMPSHPITIGKPAVSKVLSAIVSQFAEMPPPKTSATSKRHQQNLDALNKASQAVDTVNARLRTEAQSFMSRLQSASENPDTRATIEGLNSSLQSFIGVLDSQSNAYVTHNTTMSMILNSLTSVVDSIGKQGAVPPSNGGSTRVVASTQGVSPAESPVVTPGRRRKIMRTVSNQSNIDTITEDIETKSVLSMDSPSVTPSRRKIVRRTPSIAGTEYTTDSGVPTPSGESPGERLSPGEGVHIRAFGTWFDTNMNGDTTYSEILESSATEMAASSPLSIAVLQYIRDRKQEDTSYDAFDELTDPDSKSSRWVEDYKSTNIA